jgi:hypothetical protein
MSLEWTNCEIGFSINYVELKNVSNVHRLRMARNTIKVVIFVYYP